MGIQEGSGEGNAKLNCLRTVYESKRSWSKAHFQAFRKSINLKIGATLRLEHMNL